MIKRKRALAFFVGLLISAVWLTGYTQPNDEEIVTAFRDAVNFVLYPEEVGHLPDLFSYEIKEKILPKASEIMAKTISLVYEKTGEDIGIVDVFAVLSPNIEKVLLPKKEEIGAESMEILDNQAKEK